MENKFIPHIPKPCPKQWENLQGEGNCRFCDHCQHHVHDITDMGDQERMALFSDPKKRICITYLKQPDREPARTSWVGRFFSRPRHWIRAALAMFIPLGMAGCETKNCGRTLGVPLQPKDVPVPNKIRVTGYAPQYSADKH